MSDKSPKRGNTSDYLSKRLSAYTLQRRPKRLELEKQRRDVGISLELFCASARAGPS